MSVGSFAPLLQPWAIKKFPAIAHVDGTARPQTVSKAREPWLHDLLTEIAVSTGAPILINTSFNAHGKPIVNTLKASLEILFESNEMDFLVVEDWLFVRNQNPKS